MPVQMVARKSRKGRVKNLKARPLASRDQKVKGGMGRMLSPAPPAPVPIPYPNAGGRK